MKPAGTKVIGILAGALFLVLGLAERASAQMLQSTDRVFAGVSFGGQTKARTFSVRGSLPIYEETATFESAVGIGAENLLDISAGARIRGNLGAGIGFSKYSDVSAGFLSATIPDPLLFDMPRSSSTTLGDLKHKETQIHLSLYWLQPVTDKVDLSIYAGPTMFKVKQDLITGFAVAPGTSTIGSIATTTFDESTTGFHMGFDVRYLVHKNVGVGVFLRHASGNIKTTIVDAGEIGVGGFQYGFGFRFKY